MEILSIIVLVIFLFVFDSISTIPLLCRELQSKILWRMALSLSNRSFYAMEGISRKWEGGSRTEARVFLSCSALKGLSSIRSII